MEWSDCFGQTLRKYLMTFRKKSSIADAQRDSKCASESDIHRGCLGEASRFAMID